MHCLVPSGANGGGKKSTYIYICIKYLEVADPEISAAEGDEPSFLHILLSRKSRKAGRSGKSRW